MSTLKLEVELTGWPEGLEHVPSPDTWQDVALGLVPELFLAIILALLNFWLYRAQKRMETRLQGNHSRLEKQIEAQEKKQEKVGDHNAKKFLEAADGFVDLCYDLVHLAVTSRDEGLFKETFAKRHRLLMELTGRISPLNETANDLCREFCCEIAELSKGPEFGDEEAAYAFMSKMTMLTKLIPKVHKALREV